MRALVIGAGGHARVVLALMADDPTLEIVGVLDRTRETIGHPCGTVRIVGTFDDLAMWRDQDVTAVGVALGDNRERAHWFKMAEESDLSILTLRHSSVVTASAVRLGTGVTLCAGSILGADVILGDGAMVNTGAIIDHECQIGDFAHIAPGCRLGGRVQVGAYTMIGIGSTVKDRISIGSGSLIGAGSVVVNDIPAGVIAFGSPAKIQRNV